MDKQDPIQEMIGDDDIYYAINIYDVDKVEHMEALMRYFKPKFSKYGLNVEEVAYKDFVEAVKEAQKYFWLRLFIEKLGTHTS